MSLTPEQEHKLEEIVHLAWDQYQVRHPGMSAVLMRYAENPRQLIMAKLPEDEAYAALVAQTEEDLSVATLLNAIGDMLVRVVPAVIAAL